MSLRPGHREHWRARKNPRTDSPDESAFCPILLLIFTAKTRPSVLRQYMAGMSIYEEL
jgi:hypothetical protein